MPNPHSLVVGGGRVLWCTLLSKEHRGEEWELEEQMVEEYGDREWMEHRQDSTINKQNRNHHDYLPLFSCLLFIFCRFKVIDFLTPVQGGAGQGEG